MIGAEVFWEGFSSDGVIEHRHADGACHRVYSAFGCRKFPIMRRVMNLADRERSVSRLQKPLGCAPILRQHCARKPLAMSLLSQRFAQDFAIPTARALLVQWRTTWYTTSPSIRSGMSGRSSPERRAARSVSTDSGHRLIGQDDIERCGARGMHPVPHPGAESGRARNRARPDFLRRERNQRLLVVDDHDRLAIAVRQLGCDFGRRSGHFAGSR